MKKLWFGLLFLPLLFLVGCSPKLQLKDYVSEYRSDIFLGTVEKYSIFANYSTRENPYQADGYRGNMTNYLEVALAVEDNTKSYFVSFLYNGKKQENLLYYNSIQMVHIFYFPIERPSVKNIPFTIYDANHREKALVTIDAKSVKNDNVLSRDKVLEILVQNEAPLLQSLSDKKTFLGEIYIRLLYEEGYCYYYVGIIDRKGKTVALLLDGEHGVILAKREI